MSESPVFVPFRFQVSLYSSDAAPGAGDTLVCSGAFSEATGFEATTDVRKIQEGGRNWGEVLRAGATTFSTIVLKRGVTTSHDLWTWFDVVTRRANYGYRLAGRIDVLDGAAEPLMTWTLRDVVPVKFKGPDLSAVADQVAVEELHLAHEGLELERRAPT